MFTLFNSKNDISIPIQTPPNWGFIESGYLSNVNKVKSFHMRYAQYIKSNHLLVRLLHSLAIPLSMPLQRFYDNVDSVAMNVSMALKLTSSIYHGYYHRGVFYNDDHEIIIAIDDYFDAQEVTDNWKDASCVNVLYHNYSDLGVNIPDGVNYKDGNSNINVISINIAKLAIQYRAFRLANSLDENVKTTSEFIASYVLPNMLHSHVRLCYMNRLVNKYYSKQNTSDTVCKKHSFNLLDYDNYIDGYIEKTLEYINRTNLKFDVVLSTITSFGQDNMWDSLLLPDVTPTMQINWALFFSRLKYTLFLLDIGVKSASNTMYKSHLLRDLSYNNTLTTLLNYTPVDKKQEMLADLDKLKSLLSQ